jgi:8-oxo-dGTP pyrophosphatase MutT (NUDIX family)
LDLSLSRFEERLTQHNPVEQQEVTNRAAVAILLRFLRPGPDVLLMRRAERDGDRWSGHVSFPGGLADPADPDLLSTAARETREEVGIDLLTRARLLGQLDSMRARSRGELLSLAVTPFLFVQEQEVEPRPSGEAQAVFWLPLDRAASGDLDGFYPYERDGVSIRLGCWRYQEQVIWGMTYEILRGLLRLVA